MNQKQAEVEKLEAAVKEEGVQVYGEDYSINNSRREVTMAGKKRIENLAVTVINEVGEQYFLLSVCKIEGGNISKFMTFNALQSLCKLKTNC